MDRRIMTPPWHREAAETLRLGMPIAATQLLMMGLHISDMIIVARLGVFPLAAAGLDDDLNTALAANWQ